MLYLPNPANASTEEQALQEWEVLSTAETTFFFQRSHISWLSCGDGNSSLFHRYAATRQAKNHIHFLLSETRERIESQEGIQNLCINYFTDLLGSPVSPPMFTQSDLNLLFNFKCSADQVASFEPGR